MIDKLCKTDIDNTITAYKKYADLSNLLQKRMNYIIRFCIHAVNGKLSWWDWETDEQFAPGDFMCSYTPDVLSIVGEWSHGAKMTFIDKNGAEWGFNGIPTRWLYEDFEEEYTNGLKLYQEKQAKKMEKSKQSKANKKAEREALLASAKAKLTVEEVKALRI